MNDNADCTVIYCRCGGMVLAAVTSSLGPKDHAEIGRLIAEDHYARHLTAAQVRKQTEWCECNRHDDLFPEAAPEGE